MGWIFVGLGAYLTSVGWHNRSEEFLQTFVSSKGFLVWGAGLAVLYLLYENKYTKPAIVPFGALILIALLLNTEPKIAAQLQTLYKDVVTTPKKKAPNVNPLMKGFGNG